MFGLSVVMAIAFVAAELRAKNPVLNVRYFRIPTFAGANIIAFTAYFGTFSIFFMVALYLQVVGQKSPLGLALNFIPLAVGMVAASLATGRWVAVWGPRIPMATGCLLAGVGILLTNARISPTAGIGQIGWTMFIAGVGVGMAMVPVTSASLGSVPAEHSGMASSTTNTFRELGAVVGVAVLGSIVNGQLTVNLVRRLTAIGIPKAYQSLVVSAVTTGAYQGEAKAADGQEPRHHPHRQRGGLRRLRCLRPRTQPVPQHRRWAASGLGHPGPGHRVRTEDPPGAGRLGRGPSAAHGGGSHARIDRLDRLTGGAPDRRRRH